MLACLFGYFLQFHSFSLFTVLILCYYLLKYDSAHKQFKGHTIEADDKNIIFDGRKIPVIGEKDPNNIKWSDYGAELVLECTGRFKGKEDAGVHINVGGVKG